MQFVTTLALSLESLNICHTSKDGGVKNDHSALDRGLNIIIGFLGFFLCQFINAMLKQNIFPNSLPQT